MSGGRTTILAPVGETVKGPPQKTSATGETRLTVYLIASLVLLYKVFRANTFLSPVVKIQAERGQRVILGIRIPL